MFHDPTSMLPGIRSSFVVESVVLQSQFSAGERVYPLPWADRLTDIAAIHASVTGVLAGFSIGLVVLLATMDEGKGARDSPLIQATIGIFLVAFVGFVATGILYTVVPQRTMEHQYTLYAVATTTYYISSVLAFLGLTPLMYIVQLSLLKKIAWITLGGAVIGGFFAVAIPYQDLLGVPVHQIGYIFIAAFVVAGSSLGCIAKYGSRLGDLGWVLYLSCALVILLFGLSMFSFFLPMDQASDDIFLNVAKAVLFSATTLALFLSGLVVVVARRGT